MIRTGHGWFLAAMLGWAVLGGTRVLSAPTNGTRVVDGGGTWSSNATFRSFAALNQPTPPGETANVAFINEAGFLATFLLSPTQDSDGDGVPDEDDRDDDGDGLSDAEELAGRGFVPPTPTDPLRADSDGDGTSDAHEAAAGSNPHDPGSGLRILQVIRDGGVVRVTWQARDGKTYELIGGDALDALDRAPIVVDTVSANGGVPPWYETTAVTTNAATGQNFYYRVRLKP